MKSNGGSEWGRSYWKASRCLGFWSSARSRLTRLCWTSFLWKLSFKTFPLTTCAQMNILYTHGWALGAHECIFMRNYLSKRGLLGQCPLYNIPIWRQCRKQEKWCLTTTVFGHGQKVQNSVKTVALCVCVFVCACACVCARDQVVKRNTGYGVDKN